MVACSGIDIFDSFGITEFLVFPTTCFYYTYAVILFALFIVFAFYLYNKERETIAQPDIISILGISATATIFLALIMTLIKTSEGIPMLQQDIFLVVIALWLVLCIIWFFKK